MSAPTITETATETITPPRTRWAAIIWGLLFAAVAGTALWILSDTERREAVADGLLELTPATVVTIVLLSVGVLLLVSGAAGLVRREQRKLAESATATHPEASVPLAE
ncbi:hypothetical protein [Microbacterium algeriense]|uniref:hypothetical protein n=1 Tax=Microbacterium algeriense TaxID=2615184 RepID=UPI0022E6B458|nr:hypothetical protein [Microbacterium algeriense]